MEKFRTLKPPQETIPSGGGWYVATVTGNVAWLTVDGDITRDTSHPAIKLIYHKTEQNALAAIKKYYNEHGYLYAYAPAHELSDVNESQVMVFK